MEAPITAAVVGAGHIARQHVGALCALAERGIVRVGGVCDLSQVMVESLAERFGIEKWFTDYATMLAEVRPGVVHVTTPVATHEALARMALEAGAHVIVEKPATERPEQLRGLFELAGSKGLWLIEDHNYLFDDSVRQMLEWLRSGAMGEVAHVEVTIALDILAPGSRFSDRNAPHPALRQRGGAVSDFLTHLAYLAHAFVGPPAPEGKQGVQAQWRKRAVGSPVPFDEFRALIDGERGSAELVFSARSQPDGFWVRVWGTKMQAAANLFEPRLTVHRVREGARPLMPVKNQLSESWAVCRAALGGLKRKLAGGPGAYEGLWRLIEAFYGALSKRVEGDATVEPPVSRKSIEEVNELVGMLSASAPDVMQGGKA